MCFIFNYRNLWCSPEGCLPPPRALNPGDSRGWPWSQPGQALPGNEPLSHVRWINCLGQSNLILLVSSHTRVGLSNWSWGQGNDPYNSEMVGEEKDGLDVYFMAKYKRGLQTTAECSDWKRMNSHILLFRKIIVSLRKTESVDGWHQHLRMLTQPAKFKAVIHSLGRQMGLLFPVITIVLKKKPNNKSVISGFHGRRHHGKQMLGMRRADVSWRVSRCASSRATCTEELRMLPTLLAEPDAALWSLLGSSDRNAPLFHCLSPHGCELADGFKSRYGCPLPWGVILDLLYTTSPNRMNHTLSVLL